MSAQVLRDTKNVQLMKNVYRFRLDYSKTGKSYWKCLLKTCSARLITATVADTETEVKVFKETEHNHADGPSTPQWENILKELLSTHQLIKPSVLINELHSRCNEVPSENTLRCRIAYYRKKKGEVNINLDQNLTQLNILNNSGENFILFDNQDDERNSGRIIILGSTENLRRLASFPIWMCDGTFSICPPSFGQLFTMFAKVYNIWLPLLYFLMEHRRIVDYNCLFQFLCHKMQELNIIVPESPKVLLDFEQASANSFKNIFPDGEIYRCFFHLSQAVYRKLQNLGLTNQYKADGDDLQSKVRGMLATAFLSPDQVEARIIYLFEDEEDADFLRILDYFSDTYVLGKLQHTNRRGKQVRLPPLFPPEQWNVFSRFQTDMERTTNAQESFHNHLRIVGIHDHLSMKRIIEVLVKEDARTLHRAQQHIESGLPAPKRRRRNNEKHENLLRLFTRFLEKEIATEDYLLGVSKNIHII